MKKQFLILVLLGLVCSVGMCWGETVDCSGASATSSTGNTNKITSTNYSVYFTRGGGGWGVNSSKGYQGKADAIAVFKLSAAKDVKVIISNSGSKARTFTMTAKPFETVALGDEFLSILEVSYSGPYKYADCVSSSKNYAGLETTSAFYNTEPATYCTLSNSELSTSISYTTGEQNLAASATSVEYTFDETFPAGVYAVGFSAVSNSNVSLAGFIFSDPDTEAPTCTMSTASPVDVVPSASTDLTVSATHYTSLQWYKGEESDMSDEAIISGATATTYSYTPAVADAGKTYYFRCKALNSNSAAPTTPAVSENVQVNVGALTCATPTITIGDFNFEHKGYTVTITNNEGSSTLKVSTDGSSYTTQTSPYVTYATTTTHYYAKAVGKTGYDDSDVAEENVTNTFDGEKKYIAWVSIEAPANTDRIYDALKSIYNVVPVVYANDYAITTSDNIKDADLIFIDDKIAGGNNLAKNLKVFIGIKPMLNLKVWACTTASGRWGWGSAADLTTSTIEFDANYKFLSGVNFSEGRKVEFFTNPQAGSKQVLTLNIKNAPANNQNLGTGTDENTAMHAIIDEAKLDKQYLGLGLSSENVAKYSENALTIVKNAVAMMFASERLDAVSSVFGTISAAGWSTFASSYPLDLSEVTATSGASAYYASAVNGSTVTLTPTGNVTVPAGEGIMVKGTAGETFTIDVAESGTAISGNLLKGQTTTGDVAASPASGAGTYHYVFGYSKTDASEYGFYNLAATTSVPAGKAYLELTVEEQGAPSIIRIVDEENNATSIEALGSTEKAVKFIENGQLYILREGVVYDALGRKVR